MTRSAVNALEATGWSHARRECVKDEGGRLSSSTVCCFSAMRDFGKQTIALPTENLFLHNFLCSTRAVVVEFGIECKLYGTTVRRFQKGKKIAGPYSYMKGKKSEDLDLLAFLPRHVGVGRRDLLPFLKSPYL
eukprot:8688782-Pyramimonas_sp.AAC.1